MNLPPHAGFQECKRRFKYRAAVNLLAMSEPASWKDRYTLWMNPNIKDVMVVTFASRCLHVWICWNLLPDFKDGSLLPVCYGKLGSQSLTKVLRECGRKRRRSSVQPFVTKVQKKTTNWFCRMWCKKKPNIFELCGGFLHSDSAAFFVDEVRRCVFLFRKWQAVETLWGF